MRLWQRSRHSREKGAAAVEFAIVFPLFILIVMAGIDFGYYFFVSEVATNAAREGARSGSVLDPSESEDTARTVVQNRVQIYLGLIHLNDATVTVGFGPVAGTRSVDVAIRYRAGSLSGFLSGILPEYSQAHAVMQWQ